MIGALMPLAILDSTNTLLRERRERARALGNDLVSQGVFSLHCSCGNCGEDPLTAAFPDLATQDAAALVAFATAQCASDARRRCQACGKAAPLDGLRLHLWSQQRNGDGVFELANGISRWLFCADAAAPQVLAAGDALITTVLCDQLLRAGSFLNGLEGREEDALALWRRAAALMPQAPMPSIALGRAALLAGDEAAALEHLRNAAACSDGHAPACRQLGALLGELALRHRDGELLNRALDWLDQALDLEPGHPATSFALGRIFVSSGNMQDALDHLAVAATHAPLADEAEHMRGVALLQLGRADEAHQVFERLALRHPQDADALRMRAWTRAKSGDKAGAVQELDAMLATNPEDEETRNFRDLLSDDEG